MQWIVLALTELTIYFMNLVTTATLERNPTLKEEIKQKNFTKALPVGFYTYPILRPRTSRSSRRTWSRLAKASSR